MTLTPDEREQRRKAYLAVRYAINHKQLVRQPCEECGDPFSHAHHRWGYSEPLRVVWLCAPHHEEDHRRMAAVKPRSFYHEPRHWQYSEGTGPGPVMKHLDRLYSFLNPRERRKALAVLAALVEQEKVAS